MSTARTTSTSRSAATPSVRPIKVTGVIFGGLCTPGGHCFNCWQYGHSRRACPRPSRRGYCLNCVRRGDEIANCPAAGTVTENNSENGRSEADPRRERMEDRSRTLARE